MNAGKKAILWTVGFILFIFFTTCAFTISQGQHGILLRLGKLVHGASADEVLVLNPGFHLKLPFIESAKIFDTRIQTLDIKSSRIVTREKKDVMVDYYVKWRIVNLPEYFKATNGNSFQVDTLLDQLFNTVLRAEFGKRNISDLVSGERNDVMAILKKRAAENAA